MSAVVFYPTVPTPFRYAGVTERHAETMLMRTLREKATAVRVLLDHDDKQELGTTADGSLLISVEAGGVRCELREVPDTPAGRRLAAALAAGEVTGCSFGFTPRRVRWHDPLGRQPIRELIDVDLHEVSVVLAPKKPASPTTWAAEIGPRLRARYTALRARPGAVYHPPEPAPADVVIRLAPPPVRLLPPEFQAMYQALQALHQELVGDYRIAGEQKIALDAARSHPNARTIDIIYPRPLHALLAAQARHAAFSFPVSPPWGDSSGALGRRHVKSPGPSPKRPARGRAVFQGPGHRPSPAPKGGVHVMHDDDLPLLHPAHASRREILGRGSVPSWEALPAIEKYKAEFERDRWPGAAQELIHRYQVFRDRAGKVHVTEQRRSTPEPLRLLDALKKTLSRLEAH